MAIPVLNHMDFQKTAEIRNVLLHVTADSSVSSPGTGQIIYDSGTIKYYNGSAWVSVGTSSGTMSSFTLTGDSGSNQTISDGETLDIAGGTGISTVVGATDTVTVNVNGVLEDLNTLGAAASDGQFIVATGAGAFAYESGDTAIASLGITATGAELNVLDGITSTTAELNILDGVTATASELNILDGVTATATELNLLDGVTATTTELNYVDGVTSAIQTQLDAKVDGTGTAGRIPKLSDSNTITDSGIFESASGIFIDSSNTAPVYIRRSGGNNFAFVSESTGNNSNFRVSPGTESTPGINFGQRSGTGAVDTNTGIYSSAADNIEIATGGTKAFGIDSSQDATFTSNLTVTGNLTVSGTTTTVNSTTVTLDDHNIVLDSNNSTSAVVNGAGITIEGGTGDDATFTYSTTGPKFELKLGSSYEDLQVDGIIAASLTLGGTAVSSTAAELNILDGVTATATEINLLDGVTATTSELNILDGVTATATEINLLDGVTEIGAEGKITKKLSGDGTNTTYTITHSFGTPIVMVQVLDYGNDGTGASYDVVHVEVQRNSDNAVDLIFASAPSATQDYLVLISKFPAIS